MTSKFSASSSIKLALIVLAASVSLASCKSLDNARGNDAAIEMEDPLMAMSSDFLSNQANRVGSYAQPQIQYIIQQEPQASQQQPAEFSEQPRQEVNYVLVKSESGTASSQPDTPVEEDCNLREKGEYVVAPSQESGQISREVRQDYPGEIVYVSQSGDNRPLNANQAEQESFAGTVAQSSGVPATILTEIPVKDMPYEVLEKLKREYGVKVVATRERPGANLVINCDDYTGQGQSICSRQAPPGNPLASGLYSASLTDERNIAHLQGEPALIGGGQAGHYQAENPEARQGVSYVTSDENDRVAGPQSGNQEYREQFGTRAYMTMDQTEPAQPDEVSAPIESGAEEKTHELLAQPETAETHDNNSGFEAQSGGAETGSVVNKS